MDIDNLCYNCRAMEIAEILTQAVSDVADLPDSLKGLAFQEILRWRLRGGVAIGVPERKEQPATSASGSAFDLAGYLSSHNSNSDRLLGVMVSLGAYDQAVSVAQIEEAFRKARHDKPGNITRDLTTLIARGFAEESGQDGRAKLYALKAKGEKHVLDGMS